MEIRRFIILLLTIIVVSGKLAQGGSMIAVDHPNATDGTEFYVIDGDIIAGEYWVGWDSHAFLYNIATESWTEFGEHPEATYGTDVLGMEGNLIVGEYWDENYDVHGFFYDGDAWITLDHSATAGETSIWGIDAGKVVGFYNDLDWCYHSFIYDVQNDVWTNLDYPNAKDTNAYSIDEGLVVGQYRDVSGFHGFIYSLQEGEWTTLDHPSAVNGTYLTDISGGKVAGYYVGNNESEHSFVYNLRTNIWTAIDAPNTSETTAWGISGNMVVGYFGDMPEEHRGFIYTLSEGVCGDENHPYPLGDLNTDCVVNIKDLAVLAFNWLTDNRP